MIPREVQIARLRERIRTLQKLLQDRDEVELYEELRDELRVLLKLLPRNEDIRRHLVSVEESLLDKAISIEPEEEL